MCMYFLPAVRQALTSQLINSHAVGSFFAVEPMLSYGGSPVAYASAFQLIMECRNSYSHT